MLNLVVEIHHSSLHDVNICIIVVVFCSLGFGFPLHCLNKSRNKWFMSLLNCILCVCTRTCMLEMHMVLVCMYCMCVCIQCRNIHRDT